MFNKTIFYLYYIQFSTNLIPIKKGIGRNLPLPFFTVKTSINGYSSPPPMISLLDPSSPVSPSCKEPAKMQGV